MRSLLTKYVKGKTRTLKYEFAVLVLGMWLIFTVRLLLSGDATWIAAQAGNYSTITWAAFAFIAAAVGLQAWQNTQGPTPINAEYPTGEPEQPLDPQGAARSTF